MYRETINLTGLGDTYHTTADLHAAREAWQQAQAILEDLGHSNAVHVRAKLAGLDSGTGQQ